MGKHGSADLSNIQRHICLRSKQGRKQMQQCCNYKIRRFKAAVAKCPDAAVPAEKWCDGVPDGNEVQIGGRPTGYSRKYYLHTPTSACASAKWAKIDAPRVVQDTWGTDALTDVELEEGRFYGFCPPGN